MKLFWILLFFLTTIHAEEKTLMRAGYVLEGTSAAVSRDMKAGYEFISKRFLKNYSVETNVIFLKSHDDAIASFKQGELDYIAMPLATFAPYYQEFIPYEGLVFLSGNGNDILQPYITLVRIEDPSSLSSYAGKRAAHDENNINTDIYMDMLALNLADKHSHEMFNLVSTPTPQRAVLMLFFNQADIAFVPLSSWETVKTMNPALEQKLKIIDKSPNVFGYGIEIYRKNLPRKVLEDMIKMNNDLTRSEDGKQLMRIMKARKRSLIESHQIPSYIDYYLQYETLLKHHDKKK